MLAEAFSNPTFSDVIIRVDGVLIPAHRVVLSSHSPVWKCALLSGMTESNASPIIDIDDFPRDVVENVLRIMYDQVINSSFKMHMSMLKFADKYMMTGIFNRLKGTIMGAGATLSKVCLLDLTRFADQVHDEGLKKFGFKHIMSNMENFYVNKNIAGELGESLCNELLAFISHNYHVKKC